MIKNNQKSILFINGAISSDHFEYGYIQNDPMSCTSNNCSLESYEPGKRVVVSTADRHRNRLVSQRVGFLKAFE